ncbi:RagB/SusD family nutrient uptake outer membrane protein [Filimonas effusa]|uniref:RagB/SusD family nutrient uptake outer membrane protein n=1 Tax=Filimonas effusa TaxID=2508721 RepID=A0A4Q1D2A4_9BACT|nr:RagB/SusD family nutrient uptake outer membrane protein [Filimonas effusa]RXK81450.1 RagB/SusD family nutrient uptake outer membrane protein [Filimonas effusa]
MKTKNNYFIIFLLPVLLVTAVSCNKWLDVRPKDQVKDNEMFASETGFKEALSGIYGTLATETLYGKELSFGMLGVLGMEWEGASLAYEGERTYDYTPTATVSRIDAIWAQLYFAIANTNKLLSAIDEKQQMFAPDNYKVIKGEALALRAFIHFEVLRLFGASFAENPDKIAVPYVTAYSDQVFPQLSVSAFTKKVIDDLVAAEALLKQSDPIITGRTITTIDDDGYLLNRQVHLNYYAVKGLLARVYLYQGTKDKALECATEVINSNKFPWVKQDNIVVSTLADLSFSTEHLFALNVSNLTAITQSYLIPGQAATNLFSYSRDLLFTAYFDNRSDDYRWLYQYAESASSYYLLKYNQLTTAAWPESYKNKICLLRLSEMYFIAAECQAATNMTAAAEKINTIRQRRGVPAVTIDANNFSAVEAAEFRREFLGEGQLFYYYKRMNRASIPRGSDFNLVQLKAYKLPMPRAEYENASRVDNR